MSLLICLYRFKRSMDAPVAESCLRIPPTQNTVNELGTRLVLPGGTVPGSGVIRKFQCRVSGRVGGWNSASEQEQGVKRGGLHGGHQPACDDRGLWTKVLKQDLHSWEETGRKPTRNSRPRGTELLDRVSRLRLEEPGDRGIPTEALCGNRFQTTRQVPSDQQGEPEG